MSHSPVQEILKMIDTLSDRDRDVLQQELLVRAEAHWRREAEAGRREAKSQGIDQAAIDEAVRKVRYGA